jgi:hypothetical protein
VIRHGGAERDRYDRVLGQMFVTGAPETWVQGKMVADGFARVYSFPRRPSLVSQSCEQGGYYFCRHRSWIKRLRTTGSSRRARARPRQARRRKSWRLSTSGVGRRDMAAAPPAVGEIAGAIISSVKADAIVAAIDRQTNVMVELVAVTRSQIRTMNTLSARTDDNTTASRAMFDKIGEASSYIRELTREIVRSNR